MNTSYYLLYLGMEYDKKFLISRFWWNKKKDRPFKSLIKGDKSTITNLGWFELVYEKYELTKEGEKHYKILITNN